VGELQEHDKRVKGVSLFFTLYCMILHLTGQNFFQVTPSEERMQTVNLYFVPVKLYNMKL